MRALGLLMAAALSGCTLLLDVDSVRRNRDAGAGGGTAEVDAGPQFVAQPCGARPPLECVTIAYDGGAGFGSSGLAAIDGGFLGVVERFAPHRVELYRLGFEGFVGPLTHWDVADNTLGSLTVAASGEAWAVSWVSMPSPTSSNTSLACVAGSSLASFPASPVAVATPHVDASSVATNSVGDVALAAADMVDWQWNPEPLRGAVGDGGCPTALVAIDGGVEAFGPAAVTLPNGDFRLVGTGYGFGVYRPAGGGLVGPPPGRLNQTGLSQNSTATTDGRSVMTLYSDGSPTGLVLKWFRVDVDPPDLTDPGAALFPGASPWFWSNGSCGPGCVVSTIVPDAVPADLTVAFTDETPAVALLGAGYYTVACGLSPRSTGANTAWNLGLLGVLYTDATHASFSLCQKPAF